MVNKKIALILSILAVLIISSLIVLSLIKKESFVVANNKWKTTDGSVIYFYNNNTFKWYINDNNHSDNYYYGTYKIHNSEDAIKYIANDLRQFGITESKQRRYIESGYKKENYYAITINNEYLLKNGEKTSQDYSTYYYGFYHEKEQKLELVDIKAANSVDFIKLGKIK